MTGKIKLMRQASLPVLVAALTLSFANSVSAQVYGTLPAGALIDINNGTAPNSASNTANVFQDYSVTFTATASGNDYILFAFREDPEYWTFGNTSLTASGNSTNLLSNPNFAAGGTLSSDLYGVTAPAGWGIVYQNGYSSNGTGDWQSPDSGGASSTSGLGVNTATSGSWSDGVVGSFDGIYQGVDLTAGDTYTLSFTAMANEAADVATSTDENTGVELGAFVGACSVTTGSASACAPSASSGFTALFTPVQTAIVAGQTYLASGLDTTVVPAFQGGTLQTDQANGVYTDNFTLDGSGTNTIDQAGNASTFSGVFSDEIPGTPGSIIIANSGSGGSVTFTGVNTYTGSTTINSGATLALAGSGSIATSSGVLDNGTFDISQTTAGSSITTLSGSGAVALGAQTLTLTGASGTFSGVIADGGMGGGAGGSLEIAGGTETLMGVNTYTGATTIDAGATLALSGTGSIATSAGVVANGTFDISQTTAGASIATLSGSGVVDLGGQTLTLTGTSTQAGPNDVFFGVLADGGIGGGTGGGLTIASGTEGLAGVNTYTGATTIDSGALLAIGLAGSIAQSSGVTANGTFDISVSYSGASIKSLSGSGAVALGSQTLTLTGASGTFSGVISDGGLAGGTGGSLILAGGTEILTGANTYTGSTTINSGATLALGDSGSIATSSGVTANGTFDISQTTSGASITTLSGSGAVALGGQTLTLTNAGDTFSGVIADGGIGGGTGGSLILASGTEILTGANTYTGSTTINSGATLALAGSGAIAASAVSANGTLDISESTAGASIGSLSGSGSVALGGQALTLTSANGTFSGVIADGGIGAGTGGSLIIAGGTETLTGANTYTGNTAIGAGASLQLGAGGTTGSIAGNVADDGTLVFNRADTVTYSGVVSGTGALTQAGTGTVILTGVNTYTGSTTINSGATLALAGSGAIAASAVSANGTLDISQSTAGASIGSLSGSGSVALGGQALTLTSANGTFSGVIADGGIGAGTGGSLIIAGGTETLTGANTYTGNTAIGAGASLQLGAGGTTGSIAGNVADDGTLVFNRADTVTYSGVVSGTGALTQAGTGTVILTGVNTYTGSTTINSGATLALAGSGSIAASSGVTANGTFDISQTTSGASVASLSGSGVVDLGGETLTLASASGTFTGVISDSGAGSNTVGTVVVASGTQILTGANTYTGNTAIAAGATLQVGNGGTSGSLAGNVSDDGALVFNRADTVTYSGVVFGTGAVTQSGTGTTILNGVNTVTGVTTVQAGVLEVGDASHTSASLAGNVVVGSSGTLRGHGTVAGSVTNTAGGTVAPGGTIGTLTVGSYAQGANSTLAIEVSPTAASQLNVLGAASLNGKLALTFDPGTYGAHAVYQIVSAASLTGTFSSVTEGGSVPSDGLVYSLSYGAKQADLVVESTSGAQIYGGVATATLDEARGFASLVADRSGDAGCADGSADSKARDCQMGAWAQAIASTDNVGTAASGFGFNNTGAGAMGGLDRRVGDNATVGAAFGFEQNDLRMGGASATASGSSYFGAIYAHWIVGPAWIDGQGFYMHSNWAVNRANPGSGVLNSNPNGGTKGFLVQASVPVGADFRPYARFTYANFDRDGVTETGVSGQGYALPLQSSRTALAEAGLQWSHSWVAPGGIELRPALEMGVQNDLADQNRDVIGSLAGVADTGFTVSSVRLPPTAGVADASLKVKVSSRFELTADLRDRFSANQTDASASLGGLFHF
jgi:autotransporter-associated beta strand protein